MNFKHGQKGTRLYDVWRGMIKRCENPNDIFHKSYRERGISICPEWRKDAAAFFKWALANGYKDDLTIDRINNDGNYEPSNCRFATAREQARNTRRNRYIKIGKEVKLLCEWVEQSGIKKTILWWRLNAGWPEHKLLMSVRFKQRRVP